jgi:hypothetical protein
VPLMTYRVYGILGAACRNKKSYDKNTTGLIMVMAGLIANALSKAELTRNFQSQPKPAVPPVPDLEAVRAKAAPFLGRMVKKPVKTTPLQDTLPVEEDDVLARLLKNKRASSAASKPLPQVMPVEDVIEKTPLRPAKVALPPSIQPTPPAPTRPVTPPQASDDIAPVKKLQKPTGTAHSPHPRKITSYREAHRKK